MTGPVTPGDAAPPNAATSPSAVPVDILAMGEHALLVETESIDDVLVLTEALNVCAAQQDLALASVTDIVPAARTVLLVLADDSPEASRALLTRRVRQIAAQAQRGASLTGESVEIRVRYDGPDLEEVAQLSGLSVREVVAAHTGSAWRVGFSGFAPGFAYLVGGDPRLFVPRRSSPRTTVPAGSVALAGEFSGIYPRSSPGGWQLIGSTDAVLWDTDRDPPALLNPGTAVRFVEVS